LRALLFFLILLFSCDVNRWRCQKYSDYVEHEVYGKLEKKYIDRKNHSRQTLILELLDSKIIETETPLIVTELYDTIRIGDILIKQKNTPTTIVKRGNIQIVLKVEKSDWCKEN
jgi:hypothetical protein